MTMTTIVHVNDPFDVWIGRAGSAPRVEKRVPSPTRSLLAATAVTERTLAEGREPVIVFSSVEWIPFASEDIATALITPRSS